MYALLWFVQTAVWLQTLGYLVCAVLLSVQTVEWLQTLGYLVCAVLCANSGMAANTWIFLSVQTAVLLKHLDIWCVP